MDSREKGEKESAYSKVERVYMPSVPQNSSFVLDKEGDKECEKVLAELENIDDEADALDINFVKVSDPDVLETEDFADELPKLVYFRNEIPLMYDGERICICSHIAYHFVIFCIISV